MTVSMTFETIECKPIVNEYCLICGNGGRHLASSDRYGINQRSVICKCGHVWLTPRMSAEGYAEFYEHHYRPLVSEFHGREINAETIQVEQTIYGTRLGDFLDDVASLVQLDVGGSTGYVAFAMRNGRELEQCTILDPCQTELDEAAKLGLNTIHGTLSTTEIEGPFDLITICQTIDHMLDPHADLDRCRNLLSEDGHIFVDFLDFERTKEIKIDHPHNFNFQNACRLMAIYFQVIKFERSGNHMRFLGKRHA